MVVSFLINLIMHGYLATVNCLPYVLLLKRSGSKSMNWKLYPQAVEEMARVGRRGTARMVLMTEDRNAITKVWY